MKMLGKFRYLFQFQLVSREIKKKFFIPYNRFLFKIAGVSYGRNMRVYNRIYLLKKLSSKICIGNNFLFTSEGGFNPLCRNIRGMIYADYNAKILIGDNSGASSAVIWARENITIGDNVKIGGGTIIMDHDAHSLDYKERRPSKSDLAKTSPVIIENDVLIGTQCLILKGVTIGARSIIGAGSVVTTSIPSDCIAAGNPCKIIRHINIA